LFTKTKFFATEERESKRKATSSRTCTKKASQKKDERTIEKNGTRRPKTEAIGKRGGGRRGGLPKRYFELPRIRRKKPQQKKPNGRGPRTQFEKSSPKKKVHRGWGGTRKPG